MARRLAAVAILAVLAGCGANASSGAADRSTATYLPATTVYTGSFPTVPLTAPTGVAPKLEKGQAWCPALRTPAEGSGPGDAAVAERNLGALMAYAVEHPTEAGSPWFDAADDDGRVVMGFTADVAAHRAALTPTLADPDRVLICQVRHSAAEVAAANAEVGERARTSTGAVWRGWGGGIDRAQVWLRADQRALADELVARYGDLVELRLGLFPYPLPDDRSSLDDACGGAPPLDRGRATTGVVARVALASTGTTSGADLEATVQLTNEGATTASITFGAPLAVIVRAGTTDVVGVSDLGIAALLDGASIAPGASEQRPVTVATASCVAEFGATLPPGDYEVVVVLAGPDVTIVSEPAPVTLTA